MLDVISIVPGAEWPAIPSARASQLLALQFQLERSQWHSISELRATQLRQLASVVAHAQTTVPFYRERLTDLGCDQNEAVDLRDWQSVAVMTRSEIQAAGDQVHSRDRAPHHGEPTVMMTTGSTGRPVATLSTTLTRMMWNAITLRPHLWHGRDLSKKFATIRWRDTPDSKLSETSRSEYWGTATAGVVRTGPAVAIDIRTPLERQAEWLIEEDPDYLLTYPSNALALIRHFRKSGQRLSNLRELRTFGEMLDPQLRMLCREVWDVPLVDNYSAQEFGHIALQCPESNAYHVQSESLLVEVIDKNGRPCTPGQIGRVVVSTLQNFAMPLLRYEIGDYAEVGEPCRCGRGLPVLNRIVGRSRNMFRLPDGRQIWPSLSLEGQTVPAAAQQVAQFQVIQRRIDRLQVRLVTGGPLRQHDEEELRRWLHRSLGYPFEIDFDYVETIQRSAGGKYEDFRSEVE